MESRKAVQDSVRQRAKTFKETAVLGAFFLLLVTTYSSFSHIVSYIAEHSDKIYAFEGEVALILNYVVYLLGLSRAPSIRNFKRQFLIAAICYSTNYALYLLNFGQILGLLVSIVGAIVGGFGASVLWVSQGGYMMKVFKINQIEKNSEGYYMGILNGLVYGSSLFGAIIITFGLGLFGNQIYFLILTAIGVLGFLICFFFLDPLSQVENQSQQQPQSCQLFLENIKEVARFFPKMKYLFAALMLDGLMLGFVASYFSHIIPESIRTSLNLGIILMVNGVGAMIGGYFSGYLSDMIRPSQLGIMGFLVILMTLLLTLLSNYIQIQTLTYPKIISFLWGVSVYFLEGWIFVCCAKVYEGKIESFAIVKQVHTFSFILFQVYMIITKNNINNVAYLIFLIILTLLAIYSSKGMQKLELETSHDELVEEHS